MSAEQKPRWVVAPAEPGSLCRYVVVEGARRAVCRVMHSQHQDAEEAARLLASAPALLEALQRIAGFTASQFMTQSDFAAECQQVASAAIAAATAQAGEQHG